MELERAEKVRQMKEELERKLLADSEGVSNNEVSNEEREKIQQLVDEMEVTEVNNFIFFYCQYVPDYVLLLFIE